VQVIFVKLPTGVDMLETVARQTAEDLAVQVLEFTLPDPADPSFEEQLESAWRVCDRFDLQTDIWRGRLLRSVRNFEKGGGGSFERWLVTKEISRSRAYRLIELADCADQFLAQHPLQTDQLSHFSKAAFISAAKCEPAVQQQVIAQAQRGERVTQRQVEDFQETWLVAQEDILPEVIRTRVAQASLPARSAAKAAQALSQLPEDDREILCEALVHHPDLNTLRQVATDAQAISRTLANLSRVQVLTEAALAREALGEAARLGVLAQTLDLLQWAARVERSLSQLYTAWQRLGALHDQLQQSPGGHSLGPLLAALEPLTQPSPAIDVGAVRLTANISCTERWQEAGS